VSDDSTPIDGEAIPPKKPPKGSRRGFGRDQTPEEREREEKATEAFQQVAIWGMERYPGWEPSDQDRLVVKMLKFTGNTDEQVAEILGMHVETLQRHFPKELHAARKLIIADLATRAVVRARDGNDVLTMFLLKTRGEGAFSERGEAVRALAESAGEQEGVDENKRAALVGQILDLLDARKNPDAKKTKPKPKEDGE
jgi:hypothetical protein